MKQSNLILFFILLGLISSGCADSKNDGGTTTGNPLVELAMTNSTSTQVTTAGAHWPWLKLFFPMAAQALPPVGTVSDLAGNVIALNSCHVVVGEIEFKESDAAEQNEPAEIKYLGPYVVDLFAAAPVSFGSASVSANQIRRVKMKLQKMEVPDANAPSELVGSSFLFKGSKNNLNFTVAMDEGFEYEISGPNPLTPADGTLLLMTLKVPALMALIDFTQVGVDSVISSQNRVAAANPCPLVNSSAQDIYTCFKEGLKLIGDLGADKGRDGKLDGDDETVK